MAAAVAVVEEASRWEHNQWKVLVLCGLEEEGNSSKNRAPTKRAMCVTVLCLFFPILWAGKAISWIRKRKLPIENKLKFQIGHLWRFSH